MTDPRASRPGDGFREAFLRGLSARRRRIPCKFLYDAEGSRLFDRITGLPGYYLTRAETALLTRHGREIGRLAGAGRRVVEFGAGSMVKTGLLLEGLAAPSAYVPIDVCAEALETGARNLGRAHPGLAVRPVLADFNRHLVLPPDAGEGPVLGFFPGSTIGNMRPHQARAFLRRAGRLVGRDGLLLVGVDPTADPAALSAAYDDAEGVTAAFVRNLLVRARRELGAEVDVGAFAHRARWNMGEGRVEIHLVSRERQEIRLDGHHFSFRPGDTIHAEDCYKYGIERFHGLARAAGLEPVAVWSATPARFALHLLAPRFG